MAQFIYNVGEDARQVRRTARAFVQVRRARNLNANFYPGEKGQELEGSGGAEGQE
jgi:hypothetical protein